MESKVEILPFVADRLEDAKAVVTNVFGASVCRILDQVLSNPLLRKIDNANAGEVVYVNGRPEGFNAVVLRKLFLGKQQMFGSIGSTLGLTDVARKEMVAFDLLAKVVKPRLGSVIFFGNSANKDGMRINRALGMTGQAPKSCAEKKIAVLRPLRFAWYLVRSKVFRGKGYSVCHKINVRIDKQLTINGCTFRFASSFFVGEFDEFWNDYVKHNDGLVCSRTGEELDWIFGYRLSTGRAVCVEMVNKTKMVGYIIFTVDNSGKVWNVGDMIVMSNDKSMLDLLLKGGLKLLKAATSVVHCTISGFADCFQSIIEKHFSISRALTNNQFAWKIQDPKVLDVEYQLLNSEKSWFFGPYDGDICMCG